MKRHGPTLCALKSISIWPAGVGRTGLSPTWSGPEGSSHNDSVPGRSGSHRVSCRVQRSTRASERGTACSAADRTEAAEAKLSPGQFTSCPAHLKPTAMTDDESPGLGLDLP